MKVRLLSPAGDMMSLKQAVYNGADEVYLGIKDFNARNNIEGFDMSSLRQAVEFAHVYNVKVHLTVNILFDNSEFQDALNLVVDAYNIGVDAFIVQDIGLISLISKYFPMIEIHASTQMGIHNLEGVRELEKLGVKRVVLARETPLDEIKRIRDNSDIEIEYFVQGALCISFSGNCYLSSYLNNASGNRGKCKQLCRLPYSFYDNDKLLKQGYLLSAKDFCILPRLNDLIGAGVDAIKIEGRARRPFYVATATKYYRDKINGVEHKLDDLKLAFNRGFTPGYFDGNENIISFKSGHQGLKIGKIQKIIVGKKFNEVYIKTDYDLKSKSVLKIFRDGDEIGSVSPYDVKRVDEQVYRLTTTSNSFKSGDDVNLLLDNEKEQKLESINLKKDIDIIIDAYSGQPIVTKIKYLDIDMSVEGDVCEKAKNNPLKIEDFQKSFEKNNYFKPNLKLNTDKIFMPISKLNEFRRKCYQTLLEKLTYIHKKIEHVELDRPVSLQPEIKDYHISLDGEVDEHKIQIYSPEVYEVEKISAFKSKCERLNKIAYLDLPNFALRQDIAYLRDIVDKTKIGVVANNLYALDFDTKIIAGGGLNIYNEYSAGYFNVPYIVAERSEKHMPYMTLRFCPMKEYLKANCKNCLYKDGYYYKMQNGKVLRLKRKKLSSCTFYLTD